MRVVAVLALCFVGGCSPASPRQAPSELSATPPATIPTPASAPTELYTDAEIRKLANYEIEKVVVPIIGILDVPCLDVVPEGKALPRGEVFKTLGIEDARVRDFRSNAVMGVVFLTWQVSPSYDISCMSAVEDPANHGQELTDLRYRVYGIRLVRRAR